MIDEDEVPGAAGWRRTTLGELCAGDGGGIQTGPFGSQLHASDYVETGIPSVMPQNIGDNTIIEEGIARITSEDASRLEKYLLRAGDIVYSRRGDVEKRSLVRVENDGWLCGTGCLRVRIPNPIENDPAFLSYLLGTSEARDWIVRHAVGATMPNLNTAILEAVPLRVPQIRVQRAIAQVLGALDDKIAANAWLNATALEVASLKLELALRSGASGFPLGKIAEFHNRRRIPLSAREREARLGTVPYFGATGQFGFVDESIFGEELVLVGEDGSVVTDDGRPVVQYIWGPSWVNNHAHVLTGTRVSTELLYFLLRRCHVDTLVTGAVQPKLSMGNLRSLVVPIPGAGSAAGINALASAAMAQFRALSDESRTLVQLRDTLLPQLMSGKLRVKDAEKQVEAVV